MLEIDGSKGEGGGQIIRSSIALAAVTGQAIKIVNIRAGRKKPGLLRQHLTAVQGAARVCNADVGGAELGASSITFEPHHVSGGHFEFKVGSAGSATLVAQTVLPAVITAAEPSTLIFEGGTHNPWAPPFDFLERVFLPQLAKFGPRVTAEIQRFGFFPAGGGKFELKVDPCSELRGIELNARDGDVRPRVRAIVSDLPRSVGERECEAIRKASGWSADLFRVDEIENPRGPGNVVMIELASDNVTEIFTGFGKVGTKAEMIARQVWDEAQPYLKSDLPVGEYLADQLMMPMALAALHEQPSEFRTTTLSQHSHTHLELLSYMLGVQYEVEENDDHSVRVRFSPHS